MTDQQEKKMPPRKNTPPDTIPWLPPGWPQMFAQLGALGVVCWILYYGVTTTLPSLHQEFTTELRSERQMFREETTSLRKEMEKDREVMKDMTSRLLESNARLEKTLIENQKLMLKLVQPQ